MWAQLAADSPGTAIARAQMSRWYAESNEKIMAKLNAKIGAMLEGISDTTERQAAEQVQESLAQKRKAVAAKYGKVSAEDFRTEMTFIHVI